MRGADSDGPAALPGDGSRRGARWIGLGLAALLALMLVSHGFRIARLPAVQQVSWNVVIDDGYYYLQVARNIARGHGSTFDRVNATNGYQPLWALALVPIFWFTDDPAVGLDAALRLAALLSGLALVLLYLGLARLAGIGGALIACALVVANPYFLQILQGGLETPLVFLGLAGLICFWAYRGEGVLAAERWPCLTLGLLLGLIVLARVDLALLLLPLCLALVAAGAPRWGTQRSAGPGSSAGRLPAWDWRLRLRRALLIAAPACALLLPYLAWNLATQGSLLPVSGQVKNWVAATHTPTEQLFERTEQWRGLTRTFLLLDWPDPAPEARYAEIKGLFKLPLWLLAAFCLRLVWSRRARRNVLAWLLAGALVLGVTAHGLVLYCLYRSCGHWNYHYFFPFALLYSVGLALIGPLLLADLALLVDHVAGRRLRPGFAAWAAALALPAVFWLLQKGLPEHEARYQALLKPAEQSFRKCRLDAASYLQQHYPQDAVFGAWWAGTIGYFSDRRVVNLDGVINSSHYFRTYLKQDRVADYVLSGPIEHLIDFFWRRPLGPGARPAWRAFFWEHDKEHIVKRLEPQLQLERFFRFKGDSGMYLLDVIKP